MSTRPGSHPFAAHPSIRMAAVSTGFALLLSAAVLSGSFVIRQQASQPSFGSELRELRGVSTADLDAQDNGAGYDTMEATVLANQAAEQTHELAVAGRGAQRNRHHGSI